MAEKDHCIPLLAHQHPSAQRTKKEKKPFVVQIRPRASQKETQSSATRWELGRIPLGIDVVANIIILSPTISLSENARYETSVLGEAQKLNEQLAEQNRNNLRLCEHKLHYKGYSP